MLQIFTHLAGFAIEGAAADAERRRPALIQKLTKSCQMFRRLLQTVSTRGSCCWQTPPGWRAAACHRVHQILISKISHRTGFANEGQLLLLSAASLAELRRRIPLDDVSLNALRPSDSVGGVRDANGSDSSALAAQQKPAAGGGGVPGLKGTGASPAGDCGIGGGGATAGGRAADLADVARFRPNLLVEGSPAFAEDAWRRLRIGPATFSIAGGPGAEDTTARSACATALHMGVAKSCQWVAASYDCGPDCGMMQQHTEVHDCHVTADCCWCAAAANLRFLLTCATRHRVVLAVRGGVWPPRGASVVPPSHKPADWCFS